MVSAPFPCIASFLQLSARCGRCRKYFGLSAEGSTNPFPGSFIDWRGTLRLLPVTVTSQTYMEWELEFLTEPQVCPACSMGPCSLRLASKGMQCATGKHAPTQRPCCNLPSASCQRSAAGHATHTHRLPQAAFRTPATPVQCTPEAQRPMQTPRPSFPHRPQQHARHAGNMTATAPDYAAVHVAARHVAGLPSS